MRNRLASFLVLPAALALVLLALHLLAAIFLAGPYVEFAERHLARDGDLENPLRVFWVVAFALVWLAVFFASHVLFLRSNARLPVFRPDMLVLLAGSAVIIIGWFLFNRAPLYREDALVETASAFVALAAGSIFLAAAWLRAGVARLAAAFWGAALMFVGFEEISWGQRFFVWETPAGWNELNAQGETNLHNLANPLFLPIYFFAPLALAVAFLNAATWKRLPADRPLLRSFVPSPDHAALGYVFFFLALSGLIIGTELIEEVCYFIALVLAIRGLRQALAARSEA